MNARIHMIPAKVPGNSGAGVRFDMGDGPAQLTQGFGGMWEAVPRPQKRAAMRFVGADPIGQDIPILIDGFAQDRPIDHLLDGLLLQQQPKDGGFEGMYPPTIWRIQGPIHMPQKRWVVADIEFGDALRNEHGRLVRQAATLKLMEYVRPDRVKVRKLPRKIKPRNVPTGTIMKEHGKVTLRQIAVKYYGTPKAARPLGKAQKPPIRDVRKKLSRPIKLVRITLP